MIAHEELVSSFVFLLFSFALFAFLTSLGGLRPPDRPGQGNTIKNYAFENNTTVFDSLRLETITVGVALKLDSKGGLEKVLEK